MADTIEFHDARVDAILSAVRTAFAEKGFDGASMQDLARAAGMSAGNFYRYFPSKDAIVAAMIARDLTGVKADFERILASDDPVAQLVQAFEQRMDGMDCKDGPLWAEIDAAAQRKPEIARVVGAMEREICGFLSTVLSRIAGRNSPSASRDFEPHACFMILLFKATAQRLTSPNCRLPEELRAQTYGIVMQTIRTTIAEATSRRHEGI